MSEHLTKRKRASANLFPLPLEPFEEYMLLDDRPDYPSVGFMRLVFDGHFDRRAIDAAFRTALARHPLLTAHVQRKGRRLQWVAAENAQPVLDWIPADQPLATTGSWCIDLNDDIGFRLYLRASRGQTEMLTANHHSCCDGLGVVAFVNDVLVAYARQVAPDDAPELRPLDPQRLRRRAHFGMTTLDWITRIPKDIAASLAAIEFLGHRPATLAPPGGDETAAGFEPRFPSIASATLTEAQSVAVRQATKQLGCTFNDLLLVALFLMAHRWNVERDPRTNKQVLRIMVPMNLRTPDDVQTPVANILSMVYLDRRPYRFRSPRHLLRRVRWEMGVCKRWKLGLTLLMFMRLCRHLPGGLATMLPENQCMATAALSNFGPLTRSMHLPERDGRLVAGNVALTGFDVLPSIRPLTAASFGVTTYQRRLSLAVNCDPYKFSPVDAQRLLDTYARTIVAVAENPDALPDVVVA